MARVNGTSGADVIHVQGDWAPSLYRPPNYFGIPLATHGADFIRGGGGDDVIASGLGEDTLDGGDGNDILGGTTNAFGVIPAGGGVADTDGTAGNGFEVVEGDILRGGAGNDTLIGGYDTLFHGGTGIDLVYLNMNNSWEPWVAGSILYWFNELPVNTNLGLADKGTVVLAVGGLGDLTVTFTDVEAFNIRFGFGADSVQGGAWDDALDGNGGADTINGSGGNDRIDGGYGADLLQGSAGNDTLGPGASGPGYQDYESDTLLGGAGDDWVTINVGDVAEGGSGYDTVIVELADSEFSYNLDLRRVSETGSINFGDGTRLVGFEYIESINLGNGDDRIVVNATSPYVHLGWGDDFVTFKGAPGPNTRLNGWGGYDQLRLEGDWTGPLTIDNPLLDGFERIILTKGYDYSFSLYSTIGYTSRTDFDGRSLGGGDSFVFDAAYFGNALWIAGGAGADDLAAGLSTDTLLGGAGDDILSGGAGSDRLTGGSGLDQFRFTSSAEGTDTITDFTPADDTIVVSAAGFKGGLEVGVLPTNRFVANTTGQATADFGQFVYDTDAGKMWWDANGTAPGARLLIATLASKPAIDASDIVVIA